MWVITPLTLAASAVLISLTGPERGRCGAPPLLTEYAVDPVRIQAEGIATDDRTRGLQVEILDHEFGPIEPDTKDKE